ncbi:hypothetical protein [Butyrivibrio sp. MC2021]|uniref:hypothetical protein n=1 Tax=Butyrivibrio sp. MC2021 TaxID=1408306 RepID=UPI00047B0287|nr:hypothetical protein [Butyrivibrio sp. MC2021]
MEKKISKLFDFQKYEPNEKLAGVIQDVEARYPDTKANALSDDELSFVAAAGNPSLGDKPDMESKYRGPRIDP